MRENKLRIKTIVISMLMVVCLNVYGQKTYTIEQLNKEVKQANDNFSDKNYAIAYDEYSYQFQAGVFAVFYSSSYLFCGLYEEGVK